MAPVRKYVKRFVPLESNPVEMTALMHGLGVSDSLELVDVWSIDDPLQLSVIPRPVLALILVLPASEQYEKRRAATLQTNTKNAEHGDLIWIEQTIDNACGLYAILHAVCIPQLREFIGMSASPFSTSPMTNRQLGTDSLVSQIVAHPKHRRGNFLEHSRELEEIYNVAASGGDTSPPDVQDEVDLHYVSLVKLPDGFVYELDGDAYAPTKTSIKLEDDADLLKEPVLERIRGWMTGEQDLHFSLLALIRKSKA